MVRPASFGPNAQTAASNAFQQAATGGDPGVAARARREFDVLAGALARAGVEVVVFEDTPDPPKPDAVFPNNWLSVKADGSVVLYPMEAPNRRRERRQDVLDALAARGFIRPDRVIDLSPLEAQGQFLEGTGSLIVDHPDGRAWAAISSRTHPAAVAAYSRATGIAVRTFRTDDGTGLPLYHTNVMLSLGRRFAVICAAAIPAADERRQVLEQLAAGGRELLEISLTQMREFAANILELVGTGGSPVIAMSTTARRSLTPAQLRRLQVHGEIVAVPIPTIEVVGGGSVRCMLAELFDRPPSRQPGL
jgi:hypothetical protein